MISRGVLLGFTALVDARALGWQAEAFVEISLPLSATVADLASALRSIPEVVGAWTISGDSDVLVHLRAQDNTHLEELIQHLRKQGVTERTRSRIVLTNMGISDVGP